jgi:hypothetical protein
MKAVSAEPTQKPVAQIEAAATKKAPVKDLEDEIPEEEIPYELDELDTKKD